MSAFVPAFDPDPESRAADQATRREFLAIIGSAARTPVGHV